MGRETSGNASAFHIPAINPSSHGHFPVIWLRGKWPKSSLTDHCRLERLI
jgi:hypothetical protein